MSLVCQKCGCRHDPHGACVDPLDNAYVIGRDGRRIPWLFGDGAHPALTGHKAGQQHANGVPEYDTPEDERVVRGGGTV